MKGELTAPKNTGSETRKNMGNFCPSHENVLKKGFLDVSRYGKGK